MYHGLCWVSAIQGRTRHGLRLSVAHRLVMGTDKDTESPPVEKRHKGVLILLMRVLHLSKPFSSFTCSAHFSLQQSYEVGLRVDFLPFTTEGTEAQKGDVTQKSKLKCEIQSLVVWLQIPTVSTLKSCCSINSCWKNE